MDWMTLIDALCDLRDALRLMDEYDPAHPVFTAIDRVRPAMSAADGRYARRVLAAWAGRVEEAGR